MNYEEKYKKALERAKKLKETCDSTAVIGWCEYMFPELKESEGERTRKELINFVKSHLAGFPQCEKYIAWIEKQGETTIWDKKDEQALNAAILHIKNKTYNYCGGYTSEYVIQWLESLKNRYIWTPIEKQRETNIQNNKPFKIESDKFYFCIKDYFAGGCYRSKKGDVVLAKNGMNMMGLSPEQASEYFIPINSFNENAVAWFEKQTDKPQGKSAFEAINEEKVEPKFKVGDWIVTPENKVLQITDIEGASYVFNNESHYWEIYYCDKQCSLWTIEDAKDGDVLVSVSNQPFIYNGKFTEYTVGAYCGLNVYGVFVVEKYLKESNWTNNDNIRPATKEQCNILMKEIHRANFKWDADKKELKNCKL